MTRRRLLLVALVAALSGSALLATAPARSQEPAAPAAVGQIPVWSDTAPKENALSTLALNPKSRRGYQLTHVPSGTLITAFDLDTLQPLGRRTIAGQAFSVGKDAVDQDRGRLYFIVGQPFTTGIGVIDEAAFAAGTPDGVKIFPVPPSYGSSELAGLRVEPRTNKLLVLVNPQRIADTLTLNVSRGKIAYANFIAQWNAMTGAEEWIHPIRQCTTGAINVELETTVTPFLSKDGKYIYAMCSTSEAEMQMLRLPLDATGKPTPDGQLFPAASAVGQVIIDPEAERVHMLASSAYVVTFDWKSLRLVGTSSISPYELSLPVAFGALDQTTGRLAIMSPKRQVAGGQQQGDPGGLFLIDSRRALLPQALVYDNLSGQELMALPEIDPAGPGRARRIFVRHRLASNRNAGDAFWKVITDPVPVSEDPPAGELDPTADIDESELTQSSFAGEANGYGTRVLVVGGLQGPVQVAGYELLGKCAASNREIIAASIERAGLSTVTAATRTHGADADLGTQADLRDTSRCMNGGADTIRYPAPPQQVRGQGPGWNFSPAECAGDGEITTGDAAKGYYSKAMCHQDKASVAGEALHTGQVVGDISVSKSWSSTNVTRDPKLGVVTKITSVSEGIQIEGVGTIASVTATAMSRANGRVPKAGDPPRTTFAVELCGIVTANAAFRGCLSDADATKAIAGLNDAGRNRVIFRRPSVDPDLLKGSPGGYVAGIQRERGEAALARLENNDDMLVVPGLEIVMRTNTDHTSRRYVLQLAGVRSVSTYGISMLPTFMTLPEAEAIVEEYGLEPQLDLPIATGAAPGGGGGGGGGGGPVEQFRDAIERIHRTAFKFDLRSPGDVALALGVWLTFGTPLYLADRRRRYQGILS